MKESVPQVRDQNKALMKIFRRRSHSYVGKIIFINNAVIEFCSRL